MTPASWKDGRELLVGTPTYGGVISTGGTTLLKGGWPRLPVRGWLVDDSDINMENHGAVPDILVPQPPEQDTRTVSDAQLEAAVRALLEGLEDEPLTAPGSRALRATGGPPGYRAGRGAALAPTNWTEGFLPPTGGYVPCRKDPALARGLLRPRAPGLLRPSPTASPASFAASSARPSPWDVSHAHRRVASSSAHLPRTPWPLFLFLPARPRYNA
jgi:hypothetical protein